MRNCEFSLNNDGHPYERGGRRRIIALMSKQKTQVDYTPFCANNQMYLPMETSVLIPQDEPVLLLNAIIEGMDLSKLNQAYSRLGRIEYSPRILLKILIYAYMQGIFSSHEIEAACKVNICFMYLLEDMPSPSASTICRFRRKLGEETGNDLIVQLARRLEKAGLLSFEHVFIDGTKVEANANKYTFVWKKTVEKNAAKLQKRIQEELPGIIRAEQIRYSIPKEVHSNNLQSVLKKLYAKREEQGIEFVYGKGQRKTPLQRAIEAVEEWHRRALNYEVANETFAGRNSYSKTDPDATFMHMKEDHMRNGQLKPGYNVNVASASGFIIGNYISPDRSDMATLIPLTERLLRNYSVGNVVVDSGYESEENYSYYDELENTELWVKPSNYEQQKKRKYRNDISRKENMQYDAEKDVFYCANGKELVPTEIKRNKTATDFINETTVYSCSKCKGCPLKEKCIKSNSTKPLEERSKNIYVNKSFMEHRSNMLEKITSTKGKLLRVNRSIWAEGVFAVIKEDLIFRRFMLRGKYKVEAEWTLLSLAYNFWKLHHKLQNGRLDPGLIIPASFPSGL